MISYFNEDIKFDLKYKRIISGWIKSIIESKGYNRGDINIIFTSDEYLLSVNRKYLGHDYYTDIITFDYCQDRTVSGDLFISVDSVKANAQDFKQEFLTELHRVIIHGILHMTGYDDHTPEDVDAMRKAEDEALQTLDTLLVK